MKLYLFAHLKELLGIPEKWDPGSGTSIGGTPGPGSRNPKKSRWDPGPGTPKYSCGTRDPGLQNT